jgi:hypothetical protein
MIEPSRPEPVVEPVEIPASFRTLTKAERSQQRQKLRLTQLPLCDEPDHKVELRRQRELAARRGAGKKTFRDAVRERRLEREQ